MRVRRKGEGVRETQKERETQGRIGNREGMEKRRKKKKERKKGRKERRKEKKEEGKGEGWPAMAVAGGGRRWQEKAAKALKTQAKVVQV